MCAAGLCAIRPGHSPGQLPVAPSVESTRTPLSQRPSPRCDLLAASRPLAATDLTRRGRVTLQLAARASVHRDGALALRSHVAGSAGYVHFAGMQHLI